MTVVPALLQLPDALLERLAQRLVELLAPALQTGAPASPWLDFEGARAYLGFSRDKLYKLTAARAIPHRKRHGGQGLLFHRDELDAWVETAYSREGFSS